ncbi:MAG: hypothetical protein H0Z35_03520 [Thermoanaerobacteraceae bacterium]|nr:hypothetical protein [Thermoanaerobacteraceae bacterium]
MPRLRVSTETDASGAAAAAARGDVVVIVDVIDMSTSLESALDAGARAVFGAAPDGAVAPVPVSPYAIGRHVGQLSLAENAGIVLVTEPRWASNTEREQNASRFISGVAAAGARVERILPNAGAELAKLYPLENKLVVAVSDTGGTAFDAAFTAGGLVLTATVARTGRKKGLAPALSGAGRAVCLARKHQKNISIVAASANSWEDVLAAHFICQVIQTKLLDEHK